MAEHIGNHFTSSMPITGLDCSDCAIVIEHGLERLEGVKAARVDYAASTIEVTYDPHIIDAHTIRRRIRQLGYEVDEPGRRGQALRFWESHRELLFSLSSGLLLLAGFVGEMLLGLSQTGAVSLYVLAYFLGGYHISRHALHALRKRHFDTDALMVLAALGAAALGEFAEGALLLFLFSLGHALEERALERARSAVKALGALAPRTALVLRDGREIEAPVDAVALGERVVVRPGVRVPVDGEVVQGESSVDQSPVTGESLPVEKAPRDQVFAGSVNTTGVLEVRATRLAKDSTLSRVMRMVEAAQAEKSPMQAVAERFMRRFVPAVLVIVLALIFVPPLVGIPFEISFRRAMTLLVAASPCALALSAPSAVLSGVARAARGGVLVKGGVHLETLGRLTALAFDKTGTLTEGRPRVTQVFSVDGRTSDQVLALAAAVESRSAHPLAQAVLQAALDRKLKLPGVEAVTSRTGRGLQGRMGEAGVWVGSQQLFYEEGFALPAAASQRAQDLENQGQSVLLVGERVNGHGRVLGVIGVADALRAGAPEALRALHKLGVRQTIMLTGDNPRAAAAIAAQAGLSDFRAGLLPEDKLAAVQELRREHAVVGMLGDGVNDAPALAHASVGIAMGGAATDVALETADVALMSAALDKLPFAVGLGRFTRRVILQNLALSLGVILLLSLAALLGWAGIGTAVIFHEGSTLLVVANSLRLLRYS
jgi:Zn2+/Cd2+-exporting ATPase